MANFKSTLRVAAGIFVLLLFGASPAQAYLVLDQSNWVPSGLGGFSSSSIRSTSTQVQTVTAGHAGVLSILELQLAKSGMTGLGFTVSIYDGDYARAGEIYAPPGSLGGFGTKILSINFSNAQLPTLPQMEQGGSIRFEIGQYGYHVVPGQVFSILVASRDQHSSATWALGYRADDNDPSLDYVLDYPRGYNSYTAYDGATFVRTGVDRSFRTWVEDGRTVPEPATWSLMIVGFGLVGSTLRGRSRSAINRRRQLEA